MNEVVFVDTKWGRSGIPVLCELFRNNAMLVYWSFWRSIALRTDTNSSGASNELKQPSECAGCLYNRKMNIKGVPRCTPVLFQAAGEHEEPLLVVMPRLENP